MTTGTSSSSSAFGILVITAIVAAAVALIATFSLPAMKCGQTEVKFFGLANKDTQRELDYCTKSGGQLQADSGLLLGGLAGLVFFGAGGAAMYVARRNNSPTASSGSSHQTNRPQSRAILEIQREPSPETERAPTLATAVARLSSATALEVGQPGRNPAPAVSAFSAPRELADRLREARPASFSNRAPAFIVDIVLTLVVAFVVIALIQLPFSKEDRSGSALGSVYILILTATFVGYEWVSGMMGASLGMRAFGMRIIRVDGSALSSATALWRAAVMFGSGLTVVGPLSDFGTARGGRGTTWHLVVE